LRRRRCSWATVFRRGHRVIAHHHVTGTSQDGVTHEMTVADVYTFYDGWVVHLQAYPSPDQVP
jgi:ketosteroid isomerase-like protein